MSVAATLQGLTPPAKMSSEVQLPVFTQTNLGTRIVIPVSPDITAGKFKRELERAHINCFPELGFLSIDAVMVKRNSYIYHLPDLLPLKHVFQGFQDSWFLHVDSSLLNKNSSKVCQNLADIKSNKHNTNSKAVLLGPALVATAYPSRKKKKRKKRPKGKKFSDRKQEPKGNVPIVYERDWSGEQEVLHPSKVSDSIVTAESPRGSFSEAISVSGIIDRYFTNFVSVDHTGSAFSLEVASTERCDVEKISFGKKSSKKPNSIKSHQRLLPLLLPEDLNSAGQKNKYERSEVGKRLVVASNNIGSSQRSALSKGKKLWNSDAGSIVRNLMFEINTND